LETFPGVVVINNPQRPVTNKVALAKITLSSRLGFPRRGPAVLLALDRASITGKFFGLAN
jgi:hypothetical protein